MFYILIVDKVVKYDFIYREILPPQKAWKWSLTVSQKPSHEVDLVLRCPFINLNLNVLRIISFRYAHVLILNHA